MENYVNLQPLQVVLEDLLFSVRYITTDHQDTPINVDDYTSFEQKAKEAHQLINSLLNINNPVIDEPGRDHIPNYYEANHIKDTRDQIFTSVLIQLMKENKPEYQASDYLKASLTMANASIETLYGVKL
jgi:hypothetical protein